MTDAAAPPARVPLGILDLVPVSSGSTAATALRNTIDLVRAALLSHGVEDRFEAASIGDVTMTATCDTKGAAAQ